jgi:hypothetical protein
VQLGPLLLPPDWTPEEAFVVAEFLITLHDAIWDGYGWAMRDAPSNPPSCGPPVQLDLSLHGTGEPSP